MEEKGDGMEEIRINWASVLCMSAGVFLLTIVIGLV